MHYRRLPTGACRLISARCESEVVCRTRNAVCELGWYGRGRCIVVYWSQGKRAWRRAVVSVRLEAPCETTAHEAARTDSNLQTYGVEVVVPARQHGHNAQHASSRWNRQRWVRW